MRQPCYRTIVIGILIVGVVSRLSGQERQLVPGMNYWAVYKQVESIPEIQIQLEIMPDQLKRLQDSMSRLSEEGLFEKIRVRLRNERKDSRKSITTSDLYSAADLEVLSVFKDVLKEPQIQLLYPTMLKAKYYSPDRVFNDRELMAFFEVPKNEKTGKIYEKVRTFTQDSALAFDRLKTEIGKEIVDSLPAASKAKLAKLLSNDLLPEFDSKTTATNLPFVKFGSVRDLIESPELKKRIGLSADQISKLEKIESELEQKQAETLHSSRLAGSSLIKKMDQLYDELHKSATEVLTDQQFILVSQYTSMKAFLLNYSILNESKEMSKYLELSEQERREFSSLCNRKQFELYQRHGKISQDFFDDVCKDLPANCRAKLEEHFKGVWEIPLPPNIRWRTY
ncbi:MAG: hypothetical protein U0930_24650 [Pirellulales bacterium]